MSYRFNKAEHCHSLDGRPLVGVSRVGDVINKPLAWWAAELAAVECLEAGEHIPGIRTEYLAAAKKSGPEKKAAIDALCRKYPLFKKARYAHFNAKNDAAVGGTDLHSVVEKWVKREMAGGPVDPILSAEEHRAIAPFIEWASKNVRRFLASEVHCYSQELWLGGVCDLVAELNDGQLAVIDIKSSKETYASQFWQCAGYDILLSENGGFTADGQKTFELPGKVGVHIVFPFGAEKPTAQAVYDVESDREAFRAELLIYKKLNLTNEIKT